MTPNYFYLLQFLLFYFGRKTLLFLSQDTLQTLGLRAFQRIDTML